jgi:ATP-dependent RNA helicase DDX19/DBP5
MEQLKVENASANGNDGGEKKAEGDDGSSEAPLNSAEKSMLQKVIRNGLVENKNDLEVQRRDPRSPLYSVKTFEALNLQPQLLKGVYGMGLNAPSISDLPSLLSKICRVYSRICRVYSL